MKIILFFLSIFPLVSSSQDEYFNLQWSLQNNGFNIKRDLTEISTRLITGKSGADIVFPFDLNQISKIDRPIVVAILDTGIDIGHSQLKDSILKNSLECDRLGNLPPRNSPDNDSNGFAGDCAGWNFASATSENGDNQVFDDVGHGTHLAGIIAAKIDNIGIRGISDKIKILPVKIFSKYEIPNHPQRPKMGMMKRITKGLEYAINKNVDVINLSLGWPSFLDSKEIRSLIKKAHEKNIIIVAAAGNNAHHSTIFPCAYETVICVGATSVDGELTPFSNFGGNVDLLAPGERILSTVPKKITPLYFDEDGYDYKNGTSQSAPLVAGSFAFLKLLLGDLSSDELKARILASAEQTKNGLDSLYGTLNLSRAIMEKPDSFIYPNLKEQNTIEVMYPSGRFEFALNLKKLTELDVNDVELKLSIGDTKLDIHEYKLDFKNISEENIKVTGQILNFLTNSIQVLNLDIKVRDKHFVFKKEMVFALNAEDVSEKILFAEAINKEKLRSIEDPFGATNKLHFFTEINNGSALAINFFREESGSIKQFHYIEKSKETKFVAAAFIKESQLIVELYDVLNKKLIYEFWNIHEKPILAKSLEMVPDSAVFNISSSIFLKSKHLKAVSMSEGIIPALEQNPSVFLNSNKQKSTHLYFFEELDGKIVTKILDNDFFRKSLISKFNLRFDDELRPISLKILKASGNLETKFVVGKGYLEKLITVVFSDYNKFNISEHTEVMGIGFSRQINFLDKSNLIAQENKQSYLVFNEVTKKMESFKWNDLDDDLLGPIALIDDQLLAQTQNNFVLLSPKGNQKLSLKRFSFLPGELFSEMFTGVKIQNENKSFIGLFIDGTLISERHVSVIYYDGHELVRPVLFQEKLPENCRVLNPQKTNDIYSILFLCSNSENSYLLKRFLQI
jgi:cell wall-associated protease